MNGAGVILLLLAVTAGVAAALSLLVVIPWCLRSLFRYRLWRLRDSIVDGVHAGDLPVDDAARLLSRVDNTIRYAREITALNMFLVSAATRGLEEHEPPLDERLREYEGKWEDATVRHVIYGSPSGWAVLIVGLVLTGVFFLVSWLPRVDTERPLQSLDDRLRDDLSVAPYVWPTRRRKAKREPLFVHV